MRYALRAALVAGKEVVNKRAQSRNWGLRPQVDASRSSAVETVEAAITAWAADECNRVLGQVAPEETEMAHSDTVRDARVEELDAWNSFKVCKLIRAGDVNKTAPGTRWAFEWEMIEGVESAKAFKIPT